MQVNVIYVLEINFCFVLMLLRFFVFIVFLCTPADICDDQLDYE